jgi:hypothetical protein
LAGAFLSPALTPMTRADTSQIVPFLPCVEANPDASPRVLSDVAAAPRAFAYTGAALSREAFRAHVESYDFGSIEPSFVIFHHTWNPDASWAPISTSQATWWDRNEAGLTTEQIKAKRKKQLDAMRDYYIRLGWTAAFHLLIDERWIWLFTPLNTIGVHANEGNSYLSGGKRRYSVGIEVIGAYEGRTWPAAIQRNVGWAVACLKDRLGFELTYTSAPEDRPDLHDNGLSGHRDYSTKSCPGAAITPVFYTSVARAGWVALHPPPPTDRLRERTIPGPPGMAAIYCSARAADFYAARGGLTHCGYPLRDEFHDASLNCDVLRCERVIIKESTQFGVEQALLSEARNEGWLP